MYFVVYFIPQAPLTIALFGKLFSRNLPFHTESIGSVEKESHRAGGRIREHVGIREGEKCDCSQVRGSLDSVQKKETVHGLEQECSKRHMSHYTDLDVPLLEPVAMTLLFKKYSYQKQMHSVKFNNVRGLAYGSPEYFRETMLKIIPIVSSE